MQQAPVAALQDFLLGLSRHRQRRFVQYRDIGVHQRFSLFNPFQALADQFQRRNLFCL